MGSFTTVKVQFCKIALSPRTIENTYIQITFIGKLFTLKGELKK